MSALECPACNAKRLLTTNSRPRVMGHETVVLRQQKCACGWNGHSIERMLPERSGTTSGAALELQNEVIRLIEDVPRADVGVVLAVLRRLATKAAWEKGNAYREG